MANDIESLIANLTKLRDVALDGAKRGLEGSAAGITLDMRNDPAHGDQTGATHANYTAYAVGRGADGSAELSHAVAAVGALNPGHIATASVDISAELGVILTSATDYQYKLETENAGEKAVLGPTIGVSALRLTQAAAAESKRVLGG